MAPADRQSIEDVNQVLANIEADDCIHTDVDRSFFEDLASLGAPATPQEAMGFCDQVIQSRPNRYQCSGRPVPGGNFVTLLRLALRTSLEYILRESDKRSLRRRFGLPVHDPFKRLGESSLRQAVRACDTLLKLGSLASPAKVVWVTDYGHIDALGLVTDFKALVDGLGLRHMRKEELVLWMTYTRTNEASSLLLRVPRVLDGIDNPQFRPDPDCCAPAGKTFPLSGNGDQGLPEAVHLGATVRVLHFDVGRLT